MNTIVTTSDFKDLNGNWTHWVDYWNGVEGTSLLDLGSNVKTLFKEMLSSGWTSLDNAPQYTQIPETDAYNPSGNYEGFSTKPGVLIDLISLKTPYYASDSSTKDYRFLGLFYNNEYSSNTNISPYRLCYSNNGFQWYSWGEFASDQVAHTATKIIEGTDRYLFYNSPTNNLYYKYKSDGDSSPTTLVNLKTATNLREINIVTYIKELGCYFAGGIKQRSDVTTSSENTYCLSLWRSIDGNRWTECFSSEPSASSYTNSYTNGDNLGTCSGFVEAGSSSFLRINDLYYINNHLFILTEAGPDAEGKGHLLTVLDPIMNQGGIWIDPTWQWQVVPDPGDVPYTPILSYVFMKYGEPCGALSGEGIIVVGIQDSKSCSYLYNLKISRDSDDFEWTAISFSKIRDYRGVSMNSSNLSLIPQSYPQCSKPITFIGAEASKYIGDIDPITWNFDRTATKMFLLTMGPTLSGGSILYSLDGQNWQQINMNFGALKEFALNLRSDSPLLRPVFVSAPQAGEENKTMIITYLNGTTVNVYKTNPGIGAGFLEV